MLPKSHQDPLFHSRMIRPVVGGGGRTRGQTGASQRVYVGFLRSRPPDTPPTAPPGRHCLGARASRPHPVLLDGAELQCDAAGSHPVGENPIGQAEGEPWRRSRLIQVGEMAEAVPGLVRAGRPRSQQAFIPSHRHTKGTKLQMHYGAACRWRSSIYLRVHSWFIFINDRPFFLV